MMQLSTDQFSLVNNQIRQLQQDAFHLELRHALQSAAAHDWRSSLSPCPTPSTADGARFCWACGTEIDLNVLLGHLSSEDHLLKTLAKLQQQGTQSTVTEVASEVLVLLHQYYRQAVQVLQGVEELNARAAAAQGQEQAPGQAAALHAQQAEVHQGCGQALELWAKFLQRDQLVASLLQGGPAALAPALCAAALPCTCRAAPEN
jgi:hypothetical protein